MFNHITKEKLSILHQDIQQLERVRENLFFSLKQIDNKIKNTEETIQNKLNTIKRIEDEQLNK